MSILTNRGASKDYKCELLYAHTINKISAVAAANNETIRDVIDELVEYGLDRMIDDYGWDKPKEE